MANNVLTISKPINHPIIALKDSNGLASGQDLALSAGSGSGAFPITGVSSMQLEFTDLERVNFDDAEGTRLATHLFGSAGVVGGSIRFQRDSSAARELTGGATENQTYNPRWAVGSYFQNAASILPVWLGIPVKAKASSGISNTAVRTFFVDAEAQVRPVQDGSKQLMELQFTAQVFSTFLTGESVSSLTTQFEEVTDIYFDSPYVLQLYRFEENGSAGQFTLPYKLPGDTVGMTKVVRRAVSGGTISTVTPSAVTGSTGVVEFTDGSSGDDLVCIAETLAGWVAT